MSLCESLTFFPQHNWLGLAGLWLNCFIAFCMVRTRGGWFRLALPRGCAGSRASACCRAREWREAPVRQKPVAAAETEMDALLDKIARDRAASLTSGERARLEQARAGDARRRIHDAWPNPRSPRRRTPPPAPKSDRFDPIYVNAMSHFYRGELGRIMAWRARLDNTTSWAITVTSSIFTIAFSLPQVPHIIFFFNIAIVWVMLWIEARRYRFYDAFRARVRMLEAHFLVPIVSQNTSLLQGDWQKLVCEDLLLPSFKISALRGGRPPAEAQLRLHLPDHPRRVADENLPARASGSARSRLRASIRCRRFTWRCGSAPPFRAGWWRRSSSDTFLIYHLHDRIYVAARHGEISEFGTRRSLWRL